jgi:MFS family permease
MQLVSDGKLGLMYAGRAFPGLGVGSSSLVIPQYIAECAPPAIRGGMVGIFEIALQLGTVGGFWINYGMKQNISDDSRSQWLIPVGVQFVPSTFLIIGMLVMIESPRWLIKSGRVEQATKNLVWLRQLDPDHEYVQKEILSIQDQLEHERKMTGGEGNLLAIMREAFSKQVLRHLLTGCALQLLQSTTGINAINYFSPSVFRAIGFTGTSVGLLATGVYGIVKTVFSAISFIFLVDRFWCRPLLLIGSIGCIFTMYYLAGFSSLTDSFNGGSKKRCRRIQRCHHDLPLRRVLCV